MSSTVHALLLIGVVILCTQLTRWLPFLAFRNTRKLPRSIALLGTYLPPALMSILVIYCLKDVSFLQYSAFVPQLLSVAIVVVLHLWRRSTLLSIGAGTVCYMLLIHLFA